MLWHAMGHALCVFDVRLSFENIVYSKTVATKTIEINKLIPKTPVFF